MTARDASDLPRADFRGLLLTLRGRAGLGQRELAALVGVSERAFRAWEAGDSYPAAERRKALIALYVQRSVFAPGPQHEEPASLWDGARQEAHRLNVLFDPGWFSDL